MNLMLVMFTVFVRLCVCRAAAAPPVRRSELEGYTAGASRGGAAVFGVEEQSQSRSDSSSDCMRSDSAGMLADGSGDRNTSLPSQAASSFLSVQSSQVSRSSRSGQVSSSRSSSRASGGEETSKGVGRQEPSVDNDNVDFTPSTRTRRVRRG